MTELLFKKWAIACTMTIFLISYSMIAAQHVEISRIAKIEKSASSKLDELIDDYQLISVHSLLPSKHLSKASVKEIFLDIPTKNGSSVGVNLELSELISDHYQAEIITPSGKEIITNPDILLYKGVSNSGGAARLAVGRDYLYGYFESDGATYYVEPTQSITKTAARSTHIIYQADKVIDPENKWKCASHEHLKRHHQLEKHLKSSGCALTEFAIALDYQYVNKYGSSANAIAQSLAVTNMVEGDYTDAFTKNIKFEVVKHFVSTSASTDPWSATVDPSVLLSEFTSWGQSGFGINHDLGTLWTGRNLCVPNVPGGCGVAGLAWIASVCNASRYSLLEDFTSVAWALRVLTSHEIGHNFGANHDAGSGSIMGPSVSVNTSSWSSTSKTTINGFLPSYTCLEDCLVGSCTDITSISISACIPGNPSTYTIQMEVSHGGGSGSGFTVHVNGQSYSQTWSSSPQIVTIVGLIADGTKNNIVTISADDGSDSGCAGSISFDEPESTCSTTMTYNFDSCDLPANWTAASTNIYTWNNGDPLLQYEWRFDDDSRYFYNYNKGNNASTTKTIDGTCMAYFDDDIVDHSLYTGEITLTTPEFDLSLYDYGSMSFDYLFHAFENSFKSQNASAFNVDVWNGTSWISILSMDNSPCVYTDVWTAACRESLTTDITSYLNPAFKVRFHYTDGNTGSWTGTVALDNFVISAGVNSSTNCPSVTTITTPQAAGVYTAQNMVNTIGNVNVTSSVVIQAQNIEFSPGFSVGLNATLTVEAAGCD